MKISWKHLLVLLSVWLSHAALATAQLPPMASGANGYSVSNPLFTVGESIQGYTPPGLVDGMGAFALDTDTVRVLASHFLLHSRGYDYSIDNGSGGTFTLSGARISYFDINVNTRSIEASGLAYNKIIDANGAQATDSTFLAFNRQGFGRFASANLIKAGGFNATYAAERAAIYAVTGDWVNYGLEDQLFFTGEEDGGLFNAVGGAVWALDPSSNTIHQVPDFGRGAWENVALVDTGSPETVAFLLTDNTAPFDHDNDGTTEAVPLYLYYGTKDPNGDILARNGLRNGNLYVWVARTGEVSPATFNGSGSRQGDWMAIDNSRNLGLASETGVNGYDEYGYPTQRNLVSQAETAGAFGFSRLEDVATNPAKGKEAVAASAGVDTYANGADTFGTVYVIKNNFDNLTAKLTIAYDGDADPERKLRSPDNLTWSLDGNVYVQEDEAEEDTLDGEPLFGTGAINPFEASIVQVDPKNGMCLRLATIDRSVVLDASLPNPTDAVDEDAGNAGEWESSGIIDVSALFGEPAGSLFLFNVQAHGIEDQDDYNLGSRITREDLVEGGQLLLLEKN